MVGLWLFSQTRLGPGPRQQGRQVQEPDSFPEGRAVVCPVCTSAARKIKVALARARDGVHQGGPVSISRDSRGFALGCCGVAPLGWGVSETGPDVLAGPGWELGKGTSLPRFDLSSV
jgi:hypothetical protein